MAISYSRPDPSSPNEVAAAAFSTGRRGFDQSEVRDFLRMVAAELARLQERERFLERELRGAQQRGGASAMDFDEETATRLLGEEAAHILQAAREGAVAIRTRSEDGAARLLREATDEAQRLREEAEVEAARRRQDASADAEAELQMAKQQGREMVNEARAYRERVLSELARRRELARQQIEQLIHGRDRLLQVFERARLVAVDVMADLTPMGGPDEYVNLSPTTGPVPMMVPAPPLTAEKLTDEIEGEPEVESEVEGEGEAVDVVEVEAVDVGAPYDVDTDTDLGEDSGGGTAVDAPEAQAPETAAEAVDAETEDSTDEPAPAGIEEHADVVVVALPEAAASNAAEPDDDREPAKVVALFAGDDPLVIDTTTEEALTIDDTAAVDDLFARLRAARAESIAERAAAALDATTSGRLPPPSVTGDAAATSAIASTPEAPQVPEPEKSDPTPFDKREASLVPVIVAAARKLKRVLADEQNEVLDTLRRRDPVRTLDTLLPWEGDHSARYVDAIGVELLMAAVTGAASVSSAPEAKNHKEIERAHALKATHDAIAAEIVLPLRQRLEGCIERAGGDNNELASAVRAVYREWKTQRIDENLDDFARMAYGTGAFAVIKKGTPVEWHVDRSRPGCPDCDDNSLAASVNAGDVFPTGHKSAPAHSGCRCLVLPAHQ